MEFMAKLGTVLADITSVLVANRGEIARRVFRTCRAGGIGCVAVSAGEEVQAGQPLLWLEAMKMQHPVAATVAGGVAELPVAVGQLVEAGAVLAVITERAEITERVWCEFRRHRGQPGAPGAAGRRRPAGRQVRPRILFEQGAGG